MATLSNRIFYEDGNSGASAAVGFADKQNRVVRYNLDLASGESASHINVVFVGDKSEVCIEHGNGSSEQFVKLNDEMSFYFAISTDPDAFANAGYADIASATGKAIFTQVGGYMVEDNMLYEVSCDADVLLYTGTQYYFWVFPGFSNSDGGNETWGWVHWNNTPIEVTLSGSAIKTYTISYDANGGSGAPTSQTKDHGVAIKLSSTRPTRTGCLFKGWSTTQNGMVLYQSEDTYTDDASIILYAIWQSANLVSQNCRACIMHNGAIVLCNVLVRHNGLDNKCRPVINHNYV